MASSVDLTNNDSMVIASADAANRFPCGDKPPTEASPGIVVQRRGPTIYADKGRVLLRRFYPSSHDIARRIADSLINQTDCEVQSQLGNILDVWGNRQMDLFQSFQMRFREVRANCGATWKCDDRRRALIGAHFMHEYSVESAALFNPSIVRMRDQSGLPHGALRFLVSLRATGEGHISSVAFREGIVYESGRIQLEPNSPVITDAKVEPSALILKARFAKEFFDSAGLTRTWTDAHSTMCNNILAHLPERFSIQDLRQQCSTWHAKTGGPVADATCHSVLLLAEANYTVHFPTTSTVSERLLFPSAPSQSNGIEDARFVEFVDDAGKSTYYATFTAYNGRSTLPQLMQTDDFISFRFMTLLGDVTNKGMALFPRKVGGRFWMLSRQDDVSVMIMSSESMFKWEVPTPLLTPKYPFEIFKMGNCGSPLETPKGWLVITHGVGPMRRYVLGAAMLDLNDPSRVLARLPEPLLAPNEAEREGYVPNVVYTCGAMIHNGQLILPYAMSDSATSFASVSLEVIYRAMSL